MKSSGRQALQITGTSDLLLGRSKFLENHSKPVRHRNKPANYKLVEFGVCTVTDCPNNEYEAGTLKEHFHALMYKKGRLPSEETEFMKYALNQLGYVGELVVEYVTYSQLQARLKKYQLEHR